MDRPPSALLPPGAVMNENKRPFLRRLPIRCGVAFLAIFATALLAKAAMAEKFNPNEAFQISQDALGRVISNYEFRDTKGNPVRISDYRGKPLILTFVYTGCISACPTILTNLAGAVDVARDALGEDSFELVTIGFDAAADSPKRMASFARKYGIDDVRWKFLSGDLPSIVGLADEVGFAFVPQAGGFVHTSQVSIIDEQGVLVHQVYGDSFEYPYFVEPLKRLVLHTETPFASLSDIINKVKFFCTIYDPAADVYKFDYGIFIQLGTGILVIGLVGRWVIINWIRIFRSERAARRRVRKETLLPLK